MDRVLPSRELTQAWLDAGPLRGHPNSTDEWTIVAAYAEGRLVDREVTDYEAAANELHQHGPRYADPYDGPAPPQTENWRDCGGADAHEDASRRAVDAALPDQEV